MKIVGGLFVKKNIATLILVVSLAFTAGCTGFSWSNSPKHESFNDSKQSHDPSNKSVESDNTGTDQTATIQTDPANEVENLKFIHIMAVGDIMMHIPQVNSGKTKHGYNFDHFYKEVAPLFAEADLVYGNLETTLSGEEEKYSGYPLFNSPDAVADSLANAGFDIITTANNHSLDRGEKGLIRTLDQLDRVGLKATGTFRTAEEREQILMVNENDIQIATLAYTYGTNGIHVPKEKPYLINLLDQESMKRDIELAKKQGAELVVVVLHFGQEYQRKPNEVQKEWVNFLFASGADIILGSHPHVVQEYEHRQWTTAAGEKKEGVVIYSLGNFISNQREEPTDIGGILSIKVKKLGSTLQFEHVEFIPTWVHRYFQEGKREYTVLPMAHMLSKRSYPALNDQDYQVLEQRYQEMTKHVTAGKKPF